MSTIKISDKNQGAVNAVPTNLNPLSAIVKYGQSPELNLTLLPDSAVLKQTLSQTAATTVSLGVTLGQSFDFGNSKPEISLNESGSVAIHVNAKANSGLFSDNLYQSPITVSTGKAYLSVAFTGSVTTKDSQKESDITVGFDAGATATYEYFRSFQASEQVGVALGEVLCNFVMPADVTDLTLLQPGDIATCTGNRHIKVFADVSVSASAVPLASPNLPLAGQPIQVNAAAKVDVRASIELTSGCQIRARAVSAGVVELGVYKQHGDDWDIAIKASAGVDANFNNTDLLTALIGKLSKKPEADQQQLKAAGLQPDEIKEINDTISKSIDHSIHASLSLDLSCSTSDEAAFLYQIEPAMLNGDAAAAVTAALDGDFTALDRLNPRAEENGIVAPGVTLVRSILTRTKKNGVTFKLNLIGLFNFLSLAEFVSKSEAIHEPTSGDLFLKETASGDRIGVVTTPQAQTKLRKITFDSILMTTAYRGGSVPGIDMQCSQVHFAMHSTTNEHTMSDLLDWFVALGLLDPAGKAALLKGFTGTGLSTCTVRVSYSDAACEAMFLDAGGARRSGDYVSVGRKALPQLLLPGDSNDSDAYRRNVLSDEKIWSQFEGPTNIGLVMEHALGWSLDDPRISKLETDYKTIAWWADTMSSTAQKVADMRNFLKTADPATLRGNKTFLSKAADLQKHVMSVVKNSKMDFDLPFGLVALQGAAGGSKAAPATGILISPAIKKVFGGETALAAGG